MDFLRAVYEALHELHRLSLSGGKVPKTSVEDLYDRLNVVLEKHGVTVRQAN